MESANEHMAARAMLEWHLELGVDEAIGDVPVDRYALEARPATPAKAPTAAATGAAAAPPSSVPVQEVDAVAVARQMAQGADDLGALAAAMQAFPHLDLKKGARNFVFADGLPGARVMVIGEAPGRDEDLEGRPFVGRAGQLLDRMLAAIDLSRAAQTPDAAVYITNVLPWRPPANRTPEPEEVARMLPFLTRHIDLVAPDFIVLMGNTPCQALLGRAGITRIRGQWAEVQGRPALPMFHPAYLLRQTAAKREAWADLLALRSRLNG